ncbi:MAG TPA: MetQ/NlpA family ABC transporter substrate-binding protein [Syntrophorhabdus sp.]|nr:MetQ/NlpA family ABC transporter substrate-binding protein [Syntrophorhabdus sp.]
MWSIKVCILLVATVFSMHGFWGCSPSSQDKGGKSPSFTIQFGTLPVIQALPLFVAAEKGYFKDAGLDVELVPFNSAMEKDVAMSAGQISGYFGDMITPMVLTANGTLVKIVATHFNIKNEQRMFAILAGPKYPKKDLHALSSAGIACSSNTMLDYLMTRLLQKKGIAANTINLVEVKSIPIRLQMLMSDQVPAAILPEPLVTLAEMKGARVMIDDRKTGLTPTVLVFSDQFLAKNPDAVKAFLQAVQKGNDYINKNPDEVRPTMNRECKIPEPLHQSFAIPAFPKLNVPKNKEVMDVYSWLREKNVIKTDMTYGQFVAEGYVQ